MLKNVESVRGQVLVEEQVVRFTRSAGGNPSRLEPTQSGRDAKPIIGVPRRHVKLWAMKPVIQSDNSELWPSWKEFEIHNVCEAEMVRELGEPNAPMDEGKGKFRWQVRDDERRLVVHDYFRSSEQGIWSAWGNKDLAEELFGADNIVDLPPDQVGDPDAMRDLYESMGQKVQDRGPTRPRP